MDVMLKGLYIPPKPLHWLLLLPTPLFVMNKDASVSWKVKQKRDFDQD